MTAGDLQLSSFCINSLRNVYAGGESSHCCRPAFYRNGDNIDLIAIRSILFIIIIK